MSKTVYKIEFALILIPMSILLVPGFLYLFFVPFGDIISVFTSDSIQRKMTFIAYQSLTILSASSFYSLWVASNLYLSKNHIISFSKNPYIFVSLIVGLIISCAASWEVTFLKNHYLKEVLGIEEMTGLFGLYIYGIPLSLPALHLLFASSDIKAANRVAGGL